METNLTYVKDQLAKIQQLAHNGQPYWDARKLMEVLDYKDWRVFQEVIERARQACEMSATLARTILCHSPNWLRLEAERSEKETTGS